MGEIMCFFGNETNGTKCAFAEDCGTGGSMGSIYKNKSFLYSLTQLYTFVVSSTCLFGINTYKSQKEILKINSEVNER